MTCDKLEWQSLALLVDSRDPIVACFNLRSSAMPVNTCHTTHMYSFMYSPHGSKMILTVSNTWRHHFTLQCSLHRMTTAKHLFAATVIRGSSKTQPLLPCHALQP